FLDGINEGFGGVKDVPWGSERMRAAFSREQSLNPSDRRYFAVLPDFPPLQMLHSLRSRWETLSGKSSARDVASIPRSLTLHELALRYSYNVGLVSKIAAVTGVRTVNFWQPVLQDMDADQLKGAPEGFAKVWPNERDWKALVREIGDLLTNTPRFYRLDQVLSGMQASAAYIDGTH